MAPDLVNQGYQDTGYEYIAHGEEEEFQMVPHGATLVEETKILH